MAGRSAILLLLLCSCASDRVTAPPPGPSNPPASQPPAVTPTPTPPPVPVPPPPAGQGPFIVFFDWDKDELTPQAAEILDEAARDYRTTGNTTVQLESFRLGATFDPYQFEERAESAMAYLSRQGVWARPVTRRADGTWQSWSPDQGSVPVLILGPRPAPRVPPTPAPPPSPPPSSRPHPPSADRRPALATAAPAAIVRQAPAISAIRTWLTPTGTLTAAALAAMTDECIRLEGELSPECQSAAVAGDGGFGVAPKEARDEFSFLLDSCRGGAPSESCSEIVGLEREFRALPRGRLDPQPRIMEEEVRTLFTAFIIQDGDPRRGGGPGRPIGGSGEGKTAGGSSEIAIPYSRRMCFGLTADAKDFLIEPVGKPCMDILAGGGRVKFNPQWNVTPLRAGRLELRLVTDLFVNNEKREFRHEPYPLPIDVKPKLSLWDKIDNWIRRATGTVNLAIGLADALKTLFAIVAGWAIWSWFRKRKKRRDPKKGRGERA